MPRLVKGDCARDWNLMCCDFLLQEVMRDPVVAADGFTYEKEHIAKWMENCSLSPSTGLPLAHMCLTPNNALKTLLQSHTFH